MDDNKVVFLILDKSEITNLIINISTSSCISEMPILPNNKVIVEVKSEYVDKVLEYKWCSKEDVIKLAGQDASWLDQLFSLFT